ncbi:MAG: hypothetical protein ACM31L_00875 [Actinomycetota bacterium]
MAEYDYRSDKPGERRDYDQEAADRVNRTASAMREGMVGGVHGVQQVAEESVHMLRDVASDAVRSAGQIGFVAIDTARGLLIGAADGLREVAAHLMRREPPPERRP